MFETKELTLKKGETKIVKVKLLPGEVQIVSSGNVLESHSTKNAPSMSDTNSGIASSNGKNTDEPTVRYRSQEEPKFALRFNDNTDSFVDVPTLLARPIITGADSLTLESWVKRDEDRLRDSHRKIAGFRDQFRHQFQRRSSFSSFFSRCRRRIARTERDSRRGCAVAPLCMRT